MSNADKRPVGRPKGTGSQRVYREVREAILRLRLAPGADLDEASLEREYGVSQTPVREALIRLASEGLITLLPNRGARVMPIDISDVPQLFEALELAQRATIRWSARRPTEADISGMKRMSRVFEAAARDNDHERMGEANKDFHLVVARACGNRFIGQFYESQLAISLRLARMVFAHEPMTQVERKRYYREVVRQHDAMISAIENRDVKAADRLARDHALLFRSRVTKYIENSLAADVLISE